MPVIATSADLASDAARANRAAWAELAADLRRARARGRAEGGPREGAASGISGAASCCRAIGSPACSIPARRSSNSARSPRTRCMTARSTAPGIITGIGRVDGPRGDDRLQRFHHQGRHLLSDDREEASSRAGDRPREPAALHLPRRFRRREPAASDRGLSRPGSFRPHLLQPGDALLPRHPADRLRDGLLHGGRRLCAGDVGRDGDRAPAGHDLPRRPAAGEGRDRARSSRRRISAAPTSTRANRASPTITPPTTSMRSPSCAGSSAR